MTGACPAASTGRSDNDPLLTEEVAAPCPEDAPSLEVEEVLLP
jgi:hypothetical protein